MGTQTSKNQNTNLDTRNDRMSRRSSDDKNVGDSERYASIVGGALLAIGGLSLLYRGLTGYCAVYDKLGVNTAEGENVNNYYQKNYSERVEKRVTINRPLDEIYDFWRNFENLPKIMSHLETVTVLPNKRSHWKAKAPLGTSVEWDAEITSEQKNQFISWRSLEGADVDNSGSVRFERDGDATTVIVKLDYTPPAGSLGAAVARLFGENPDQQLDDDLQKFKKTMEKGGADSFKNQ